MRCDFNVPLDNKGAVLDDFKIKKTMPTLQYLIQEKAKIIVMSHLDHLDRETGQLASLDVIAQSLSNYLGITIAKADNCIGEEVKKYSNSLKEGRILMLENLKLYKEEVGGDLKFAEGLARLGDIYINEAFASCHRAYASITGIPRYLPHGAGLLLKEEVQNLDSILKNPKRPLVAIVGGIKSETKAAFIDRISIVADTVIVSGLVKKELLGKNIAISNKEKIIGPQGNLDAQDISGESMHAFVEKILSAKTVVWNGPFGKCEEEKHKKGTLAIARAIIESRSFSVVGGGETIAFLDREGILSQFSHASTGGGAMLDYVSGQELPGLKALEN